MYMSLLRISMRSRVHFLRCHYSQGQLVECTFPLIMMLFRAVEVGLKLYKVALYARYRIFDVDPLIN